MVATKIELYATLIYKSEQKTDANTIYAIIASNEEIEANKQVTDFKPVVRTLYDSNNVLKKQRARRTIYLLVLVFKYTPVKYTDV